MSSWLEGFIFTSVLAENHILSCLGRSLEASWPVWAEFLSYLGTLLARLGGVFARLGTKKKEV